ncbi:MAG: cupin domain-containing protein [Candidatus Glassbacteria bacterium]|nr:cupin domain-containing protein [Candidatus Glassbacteria bacterium]
MSKNPFFPAIITRLPQAEIPVKGLRSYLLQGEEQQIVFMDFQSGAEIPEHSHRAQWGVVLDGEIELTIDEKKRTFKKGDAYFIPEGVRHSAIIKKGYKDLTLFDQKDRYQAVKVPLHDVKKPAVRRGPEEES